MRPDLQMEMMPVASLAAYAANARMHPTEQVAQLAASIAEFGFNVPVLVDDAGVLIAGHGRVLAAKALGLDAVPAIRLGHLTEAQAKAFRLADNQLALNSTWDESLLAAEMEGRACHAIELSPAYVDVAVRRWQAFTGQSATHEADGRTFAETEARNPVEAMSGPA